MPSASEVPVKSAMSLPSTDSRTNVAPSTCS